MVKFVYFFKVGAYCMKSKVVAIFDFDGTITKGDTFLPFLFFTFGFWKTFFCLIYTSPFTVSYNYN